jgi:hypothetical protein
MQILNSNLNTKFHQDTKNHLVNSSNLLTLITTKFVTLAKLSSNTVLSDLMLKLNIGSSHTNSLTLLIKKTSVLCINQNTQFKTTSIVKKQKVPTKMLPPNSKLPGLILKQLRGNGDSTFTWLTGTLFFSTVQVFK